MSYRCLLSRPLPRSAPTRFIGVGRTYQHTQAATDGATDQPIAHPDSLHHRRRLLADANLRRPSWPAPRPNHAKKEKELHDINEYRIATLESLVQERDRDLTEHKAKLGKLKEDFTYNLKLLEERDASSSGTTRPSPT